MWVFQSVQVLQTSPELHGTKNHFMKLTDTGIWTRSNGDSFSLLCSIWGFSWKIQRLGVTQWLGTGTIWKHLP